MVVGHRNRFPREAVDASSLEVFKFRLDGALSNLIQTKIRDTHQAYRDQKDQKKSFNYQYVDIGNFIDDMYVMDNLDNGLESTFAKFAVATKL
ncbi:hypothetical protein QYF61_016727 [Mycteria americana]|uniref:Uncharacterized protein n=1 Tax=Mycteria americana TaxID=33587 RepID=A0AAN7S8R4_MYCAM|nr:hypothetical protein QYF61_016727 [Mycteria americana]